MSPTRSPALVAVITALVSALAGCESSTSTQATRLDEAFEEASAEFRVPKSILVGIGYTQTRLWMHAGEPGIGEGYGLMQLTEVGDDSMLARASRLTGLPVEQLKLDAPSNIRGAAALLRNEANRYFGEYRGKHEDELAHWWQVVMRYPGYVDPAAAEAFTSEVFRAVDKGFSTRLEDDSLFRQPGSYVDVSNEVIFGESTFALTANYPTAEVHPAASTNYATGRSSSASPSCSGNACISKVVIHTAQGSWSGTWNWFANSASKVSAHYTVRSSDGKVAQSVADSDTAWHAGNSSYNARSIGIEHEGYVDQPTYLTDAMYQGSANLTRWICDTYGIAKDRTHIIGHNEVPNPNDPTKFGGAGGHSDPCVTLNGSTCYWDWSKYMSLVNPQSQPQTGTLLGWVYSSEGGSMPSGNTKPIANATVTVSSGASYVTDATGKFSFTVPVGSYTVNASAPGYNAGTPYLGNPRTVAANMITYTSFVLTPMPTTGTAKVYVYELQSANPSDTSHAIDGALVATSNTAASTGLNGIATLTLPPGAQPLTVTREGYDAATASVSVTAGGTVSIDVGLKPIMVDITGTVSVLVYEANPTNAADHSRVLSGATVTIESQSTTTASDGRGELEADAGARTVQVSKSGYVTRNVSTNVVADGTVNLEVGLDSTANASPTVAFTSPSDGAVFQAVPITVKGLATGRNVTLTLNGIATTLASDGTFTSSYSPAPGESAIEAVARDTYGREAKATLHVVYEVHESGMQGTVVDALTAKPIANVVLTSGSNVAQTDSSGVYSMSLPPGPQKITLQAPSYVAREVQVTVPEDRKGTRHFELILASPGDALTITAPRDGATLPGETAEVAGTVKLAQLESLRLNDVEATVQSGAYKATVKTPGGTKTMITVKARSIDGIELTEVVEVTGTAPAPAPQKAKKSGCGSCASTGGPSLLALMALALLRRRREEH